MRDTETILKLIECCQYQRETLPKYSKVNTENWESLDYQIKILSDTLAFDRIPSGIDNSIECADYLVEYLNGVDNGYDEQIAWLEEDLKEWRQH